MTPNSEQAAVIQASISHLNTKGGDPYLVVKGPAGTGKTFCTQFVAQDFKRPLVFTAPTNKAVRVLREALTSDHYKPYCRTIYSLLGLKMTPNGEVKVLAKPEDPVDLSDYAGVYVDESSMNNTALMGHIDEAAEQHPKVKWIFMGDQYQLPPVGEADSPVWKLPNIVELSKIMRQDNQILKLATHLRERVATPFGKLNLVSDNDGVEGVWMLSGPKFTQTMLDTADSFLKGQSKAIAWRNVTVDKLNQTIRQELFAETLASPWQPGDRITLLEPATDLEGELVGTTDEEGAVMTAEKADHPEWQLPCWRIVMRSDFNKSMTLWVLRKEGQPKFELAKARLAAEARTNPRKWGDFWRYCESFHKVRHAYAITAHRAQGSTYQRAFVSWADIMANPNRVEALRCLYVASTRPRKELYLG